MKVLKENLMNTVFNSMPTKAKLRLDYPDGSSLDTEFYVHDLSTGCDPCAYGGPRQQTIKLSGYVISGEFITAKQEKPVAKTKVPTVKASAEHVRKATVRHAQLTRKLNKMEADAILLRKEKEVLDVELKTSREQLLAVAGGSPQSR